MQWAKSHLCHYKGFTLLKDTKHLVLKKSLVQWQNYFNKIKKKVHPFPCSTCHWQTENSAVTFFFFLHINFCCPMGRAIRDVITRYSTLAKWHVLCSEDYMNHSTVLQVSTPVCFVRAPIPGTVDVFYGTVFDDRDVAGEDVEMMFCLPCCNMSM